MAIALVMVAASPLLALQAFDASTMRVAAKVDPNRARRDQPGSARVVLARIGDWMHPRRACRPPGWGTVGAMERLIACESMAWGAPGGPAKAIDVAWCESRLRPDAFNATGCSGSGCGGLFQQHLGFWAARAGQFGVPGRSAFDPWANVVVSVRMAASKGTWASDWPVCGRGP